MSSPTWRPRPRDSRPDLNYCLVCVKDENRRDGNPTEHVDLASWTRASAERVRGQSVSEREGHNPRFTYAQNVFRENADPDTTSRALTTRPTSGK